MLQQPEQSPPSSTSDDETFDVQHDPDGRKALLHVIHDLWEFPSTTKSDFARENADAIGAAASLGYITTAALPGNDCEEFGRHWKVTASGLNYLWRNFENG